MHKTAFSGEKRENFHTKGQRAEGTRRGMPQILKDFEIKRNVVREDTNHGFKIKFVDGGIFNWIILPGCANIPSSIFYAYQDFSDNEKIID